MSDRPLGVPMTVASDIERTLLRRILRGEYEPGTRLPTVRQLAIEFGTTIPTIQRTIARLEAQGLIRARQGSGLLVLDPKANGNINLLSDWFDALWDQPTRATDLLDQVLTIRVAISMALVDLMPPPTPELAVGFSEVMTAEGVEAIRDADVRFSQQMLEHAGNFAITILFNTVEHLVRTVDGLAYAFYADAALHRRTLTAFLEHSIQHSEESRKKLHAALVEWNAAATGRFRAYREMALTERRAREQPTEAPKKPKKRGGRGARA